MLAADSQEMIWMLSRVQEDITFVEQNKMREEQKEKENIKGKMDGKTQ